MTELDPPSDLHLTSFDKACKILNIWPKDAVLVVTEPLQDVGQRVATLTNCLLVVWPKGMMATHASWAVMSLADPGESIVSMVPW